MNAQRNRIPNNILYKCKLIRERAGLTQAQVAEILGFTPQNISAFEMGRNDSATILLWYIENDIAGCLRYE